MASIKAAGAQILEQSSADFPGALTGSWIRSDTNETQTGTQNAAITSSCLTTTLCTHQNYVLLGFLWWLKL